MVNSLGHVGIISLIRVVSKLFEEKIVLNFHFSKLSSKASGDILLDDFSANELVKFSTSACQLCI